MVKLKEIDPRFREDRLKKLNELKELSASFFFYLAILFFIIGFNFSDTPLNGGWTQQFMPFLDNQPLQDITFVDSLNGWAVTRRNTSTDSAFVLKTTNSGDNWNIVTRVNGLMTRIVFINQNTGYVAGSIYYNSSFHFLKTTNGGISWDTINAPVRQADLAVLNEDTLWVVDDNALMGGIFRTTDGGNSWLSQLSIISANPNKIYMYNRNIGFACDDFRLYKTTNSGENWLQISDISESNSFRDMCFVDNLTGWKTRGDTMKITSNGGFNWSKQILPIGGIIASNIMTRFNIINKDTLWGCGGYLQYPNNQYRGILYRTINGGANWYFQIPDTAINIAVYEFINLINKKNVWSYVSYPTFVTGIHSTNGGNDTFFTSVKEFSSNTPEKFLLFQNYPNPFNPKTNIKYQIAKSSYVILRVYDVQGRELITLVSKQVKPGEYQITFGGTGYSSGIYFYSLFADGKLVDTKKMILVK